MQGAICWREHAKLIHGYFQVGIKHNYMEKWEQHQKRWQGKGLHANYNRFAEIDMCSHTPGTRQHFRTVRLCLQVVYSK